MARKNKNKVNIIPVWHNIGAADIKQLLWNTDMIDTFSLLTRNGLDNVSARLIREIGRKKKLCLWIASLAWLAYQHRAGVKRALIASAVVLCLVLGYLYALSLVPRPDVVSDAINNRMARANALADDEPCRDISYPELLKIRRSFDAISPVKSNRHAFRFSTGYINVRSRAALRQYGIHTGLATPGHGYGLPDYTPCLMQYTRQGNDMQVHYRLKNNRPLVAGTGSGRLSGPGEYRIKVVYKNPVRYVDVYCNYHGSSGIRSENVVYTGYEAAEEYVFEKRGPVWVFITLASGLKK
jgi:hypothetical protein